MLCSIPDFTVSCKQLVDAKSLLNPVGISLGQVAPYGTDSGDSFGDSSSFDGDGVGMNVSDEENYPYN